MAKETSGEDAVSVRSNGFEALTCALAAGMQDMTERLRCGDCGPAGSVRSGCFANELLRWLPINITPSSASRAVALEEGRKTALSNVGNNEEEPEKPLDVQWFGADTDKTSETIRLATVAMSSSAIELYIGSLSHVVKSLGKWIETAPLCSSWVVADISASLRLLVDT
jgi:hypothetical protein